jgi:hypothetical protein
LLAGVGPALDAIYDLRIILGDLWFLVSGLGAQSHLLVCQCPIHLIPEVVRKLPHVLSIVIHFIQQVHELIHLFRGLFQLVFFARWLHFGWQLFLIVSGCWRLLFLFLSLDWPHSWLLLGLVHLVGWQFIQRLD